VSVFNGSERYRRLVARWDFWLAIVATAVVTFVYYSDSPAYATMFPQAFRDLGLDRHTLERILYLAPVIWAGFYFSWRGAFVTSLVTLGLMLPRVFLLSNEPLDALVETVSVFVIGNVLALSFASLRKERAYRDELKRAHERQLKTMDELKLAQQNLRFYLQEATRAQEEERKRISHELHDDTIQALVVLSRDLDEEVAGNEALPEEVRTRLEELWHRRIDGIVRGVRRLSQDLRPAALDQLGLIPALEWLGTTLNEHSDIATKVTTTGKERILTEEAAIAVFRICQEALRNVWRHAGVPRRPGAADRPGQRAGVRAAGPARRPGADRRQAGADRDAGAGAARRRDGDGPLGAGAGHGHRAGDPGRGERPRRRARRYGDPAPGQGLTGRLVRRSKIARKRRSVL